MKDSEKLIQTIREQGITPVPKGYFTARRILVWVAFAMAALLGAIAFAVILFCIQQTDFDLLSHLSHSGLELFLGLLPFFWLLSLLVFLAVAMSTFRHSPKGYKYTLGRLALFCTALSILLGTMVFLAGGARRLEHAFDLQVSLYESMEDKKIKLWSLPEDGYLSGTIQAVRDSTFILEDFQKKIWTVRYDQASWPPVVGIESGEKIKIIGRKEADNRFNANQIRPWGGPGWRGNGSSSGRGRGPMR